jgi:hypothetical protein
MRTTIEIIQKLRTFLNFGWVGGEERKKGGEKQIQPPPSGGTYDNINWSGRSAALQHLV